MRTHARLTTLLAAALLTTPPLAQAQDPAEDGVHPVAAERIDGLVRADGVASSLEVVLPVDPSQAWPTVLFVHGWSAQPGHYSQLVRNLASRGFAVANFDQVDTFDYDLPDWMAGAGTAIDALEAAAADPASPLFGRLDLSRLAVMGHSYGGATTTCMAATDPRVKVAVALTPGCSAAARPFFLDKASQVQIPLLVLGSELDPLTPARDYARPAFLAVPSAARLYVELARGEHLNFTDFGFSYWLWLPLTHGGWVKTMDADLMRTLSRRYATAWIEHHLGVRTDPGGLTDGTAAARDHATGLLSRHGTRTIQD